MVWRPTRESNSGWAATYGPLPGLSTGFAVLLDGGPAPVLRSRALVLATGASELTLPFPGWELPGVMTAGAAQALLKSQKIPVGRRVVVAGTGPFLLPVAAALAKTGARVTAVEAARRGSRPAGAAGVRRSPGKVGGGGSVRLVSRRPPGTVPDRTGGNTVRGGGSG